MLDAEENNRLKELTDLIATEQDAYEFVKLVAELNQLLDGQTFKSNPQEALSQPDDHRVSCRFRNYADAEYDLRLCQQQSRPQARSADAEIRTGVGRVCRLFLN